ncbi:MAG: lysylphosphatidylglycerol synthase transmembrane domain-containing protein [Candidatus Hodarchaeales archaeon]
MKRPDNLYKIMIYLITLVVLGALILYVQPHLLIESILKLGFFGVITLSLILIIFYFIDMLIRAYRWKVLLLAQGVDLPVNRLILPVVSSLMINLFTIARAGEAIRLYTLKRNHNTKYSDTLSSIVIEQVLSIIGLLIIVTGSLFFLGNSLFGIEQSQIIKQLIILLFAVSFSGLIFLGIIIIWPGIGERIIHIFPSIIESRLLSAYKAFQNGLNDLRKKPRLLMIGVMTSASIWLIEGVMLFFIALAVFPTHGSVFSMIDLPWVVAASCAGNITFIIPLLPGAMGEYEGVVALVLNGAPNYPGSGAVSVALIDRFVKSIMLGVMGGFATIKLGGKEILQITKKHLPSDPNSKVEKLENEIN